MQVLTSPSISLSDVWRLSPLENAIYETVAYADVFDYPLTSLQIHRYLHEQPADPDEIRQVLLKGNLVPGYLNLCAGFVVLVGREHLVSRRLRGIGLAARLYPYAVHYGRLLGELPFVRMVALTGSLAMGNASGNMDFDYFILAENGRVWTCRAFSLLLARVARLHGFSICPNFIISKNRMILQRRDIYTAHELTQMIPLSGFALYRELRQLNSWSNEFLPNSHGPPLDTYPLSTALSPGRIPPLAQKTGERLLHTRLGEGLERWEMNRKIRKLTRINSSSIEIHFSADWCQGHFDRHGERTLTAFRRRLENLAHLHGE
ncbi:MAG TPA: hypothetical protein VJL34_14325 [Anaerolineales bacterium]|nr:hypothetical protein [Anaerolineales bacterium]